MSVCMAGELKGADTLGFATCFSSVCSAYCERFASVCAPPLRLQYTVKSRHFKKSSVGMNGSSAGCLLQSSSASAYQGHPHEIHIVDMAPLHLQPHCLRALFMSLVCLSVVRRRAQISWGTRRRLLRSTTP